MNDITYMHIQLDTKNIHHINDIIKRTLDIAGCPWEEIGHKYNSHLTRVRYHCINLRYGEFHIFNIIVEKNLKGIDILIHNLTTQILYLIKELQQEFIPIPYKIKEINIKEIHYDLDKDQFLKLLNKKFLHFGYYINLYSVTDHTILHRLLKENNNIYSLLLLYSIIENNNINDQEIKEFVEINHPEIEKNRNINMFHKRLAQISKNLLLTL